MHNKDFDIMFRIITHEKFSCIIVNKKSLKLTFIDGLRYTLLD